MFSLSQSRDSLVSSRQGIFYSILLTMTSVDIPISALPDSFRLSDVLKLSAVLSGSRKAHRLYIFSRTDYIMSFPCDCVCFLSDNEIKAMFMLLAVVSYLCISFSCSLLYLSLPSLSSPPPLLSISLLLIICLPLLCYLVVVLLFSQLLLNSSLFSLYLPLPPCFYSLFSLSTSPISSISPSASLSLPDSHLALLPVSLSLPSSNLSLPSCVLCHHDLSNSHVLVFDSSCICIDILVMLKFHHDKKKTRVFFLFLKLNVFLF